MERTLRVEELVLSKGAEAANVECVSGHKITLVYDEGSAQCNITVTSGMHGPISQFGVEL